MEKKSKEKQRVYLLKTFWGGSRRNKRKGKIKVITGITDESRRNKFQLSLNLRKFLSFSIFWVDFFASLTVIKD